jgi:hypothetical protein
MKGFERYQRATLDMMTASIGPLMENPNEVKAAAEALWNHLFDLPGPRQVGTKRAPSDLYAGTVVEGLAEISTCIETLDVIRALVGRPPERRPPIPEERWLQFLVGSHLTEIFLLRERLKTYAKSIERAFRRDPRCGEVRATTSVLVTNTASALAPILKIRNVHTHQRRFRDDGISRLETMGLLLRNGDARSRSAMKGHFRVEYAKGKKRWRYIITGNNKAVGKIVDIFFEGLYPLVFNTGTGRLRFPAQLVP